MPQGTIKSKSVVRSSKGASYLLTIERADGTFFDKQVSPSTYRAKKIGGMWTYFERTSK